MKSKSVSLSLIFTFLFSILRPDLILAQSQPTSGSSKIFLAVMELDNRGGLSSSECSLLSDSIRQELFSTGKYRIVDRKNMDQILKEQGFQLSDCTSQECAVQVGKLLGVEKMVVGSIGKLGQKFMLNLQLLSVETGEIESMASDECLCTVEKLSERMRVLAGGVSAGSEIGKGAVGAKPKPLAKGKDKSWYQKGWVWVLIAGVLVAGGGGGYAAYALTSGGSETGMEINY